MTAEENIYFSYRDRTGNAISCHVSAKEASEYIAALKEKLEAYEAILDSWEKLKQELERQYGRSKYEISQ